MANILKFRPVNKQSSQDSIACSGSHCLVGWMADHDSSVQAPDTSLGKVTLESTPC